MEKYIHRESHAVIEEALQRGKSILLLGARQVGKTTLIRQLKHDLFVSLAKSNIRLKYEKRPDLLIGEVEALRESLGINPIVILDEVQKVPELMDNIQELIDNNVAQFILSGSSARKLKNLLPGRVVVVKMDPLYGSELNELRLSLEDILFYGTLPEISLLSKQSHKEVDLSSYVTSYLDEEIRKEALVRHIGQFARFLELAAMESGNVTNFSKISQDVGVSYQKIQSFYEILVDCLVAERVSPLIDSTSRKKLTKSDKYLLFDLGVRRIAADEGTKVSDEEKGRLLEQWVGLSFARYQRQPHFSFKLKYWRDPGGPEVDWVIEHQRRYIPIEVKWTETPTLKDCRHLMTFMNEYQTFGKGYVICRCQYPIKLSEGIMALPWSELETILDDLR